MQENPFLYGNPILDPKNFIGRQHEINFIFGRLHGSASSSIVGEQRVGKTSLLLYITHPHVLSAHGINQNKHLFLYIDLQLIDSKTTAPDLWRYILRQMDKSCSNIEIKQLLKETYGADEISYFNLKEVFERIDQEDLYITLLLNELDNVMDNPNFPSSFFYGLRSLAIHHHLSLITSSRRDLDEVTRWAGDPSAFYNIFGIVNLGLFHESEALHLISRSLSGRGIQFTQEEIQLILRVSGCHPYFLQVASFFLFEAYSRGLQPNERIPFLLKAFHKQALPHFEDYWRVSNDQEKIILTALALIDYHTSVKNLAFTPRQLEILFRYSSNILETLQNRSLLISQSGDFGLFSSSFSRWICNEITNTLHDKQDYDAWLKSNTKVMIRVSSSTKKDIANLLPKIGDKYREMIVTWVSDPRNAIVAIDLLKTILGLH